MMKSTNNLTGRDLDYAVAVAEGRDLDISGGYDPLGNYCEPFEPSTNWGQAGPIIEREGIDLYCNIPKSIAETVKQPGWATDWRAAYSRCGVGTKPVHGSTPLIAAMRCYVVSKLGKEIEIPEGA